MSFSGLVLISPGKSGKFEIYIPDNATANVGNSYEVPLDQWKAMDLRQKTVSIQLGEDSETILVYYSGKDASKSYYAATAFRPSEPFTVFKDIQNHESNVILYETVPSWPTIAVFSGLLALIGLLLTAFITRGKSKQPG